MLRVFQAAVVLMGGLLLLITGMVGQARQQVDRPLRWMVYYTTGPQLGSALYLYEPVSHSTEVLTPSYGGSIYLLRMVEDWYCFIAKTTPDDNTWSIFRIQRGGDPQTLIENVGLMQPPLSPDGRWLLVTKPREYGWYVLPSAGGTAHNAAAEIPPAGVAGATYYKLMFGHGPTVYFDAADGATGIVHIYRANLATRELDNLTPDLEGFTILLGWIGEPEGLMIMNGKSSLSAKFYFLDLTSGTRTPLESAPNNARSSITTPMWDLGDGVVGLAYATYVQANRTDTGEMLWEVPDVWNWWPNPQGQHAIVLKNQRGGGGWYLLSADGTLTPFAMPDMPGVAQMEWLDDRRVLVHAYGTIQIPNAIWLMEIPSMHAVKLYESHNMSSDWVTPDGRQLIVRDNTNDPPTYLAIDMDGSHVAPLLTSQSNSALYFDAWGPTIDRPMNGNVLTGIGVLLCSIGAGMIFARFRKV